MKLPVLIGGAVALLLVGGFMFLASADIPVHTTTVTQTIDNGRFFNAN